MLVIPNSFKQKVNKFSTFLEAPYDEATLEWLFRSKDNKRYLNAQIRFLVRDGAFISFCDVSNPCREPETRNKILQSTTEQQIQPLVDAAMSKRSHEFPRIHNNPVLDLHEMNVVEIKSIAMEIITRPEIIDPDYEKTFMGKVEEVEYGYSQNSFRGGTWHPEDLFAASRHNDANPYFKYYEIKLDPNLAQPGNRVRYDQMRRGDTELSPIPFWQNPNKRRNYDDPTEGFRTYGDSWEQPVFGGIVPGGSLTERKSKDYYLTFPSSSTMDCKKIKYDFGY